MRTLTLVLILLLFPNAILAQQVPCAARAVIVERLMQKYEEYPIAQGIDADGKTFELFRSKRGSWTVLLTAPGGLTCVVAIGVDMENWLLEAPVREEGL